MAPTTPPAAAQAPPVAADADVPPVDAAVAKDAKSPAAVAAEATKVPPLAAEVATNGHAASESSDVATNGHNVGKQAEDATNVATNGRAAAAVAMAAEARALAAEARGVAMEARAAAEHAQMLARDEARMVAREEYSRSFAREEAQALLARGEEDRAAAQEARERARAAERALAQEARDLAQDERARAQEIRSIAEETRAVAREAREVLVHGATKIKDMLHPGTVLMVLLYASVIGFSLQARGWHYSVAHPMPVADDMYHVGNGKNATNPYAEHAVDQWSTSGKVAFYGTLICFTAYTVVHVILLAHLRVKARSAQYPQLKMLYAAVSPVGFFFTGVAYMYTYVTLARYNTIGKEWIALVVFTGILAMFTFIFVVVPLSDNCIMDIEAPEQNPGGNGRASGGGN